MSNLTKENPLKDRRGLSDTNLLLITVVVFLVMYISAVAFLGGGFRKPQAFLNILNENVAPIILSCGTMLTGGVGNVVGTLFGVLSLSTIKNIVSSLGLDEAWWTNITVSAMICLFLVLQSLVLLRKNKDKQQDTDLTVIHETRTELPSPSDSAKRTPLVSPGVPF